MTPFRVLPVLGLLLCHGCGSRERTPAPQETARLPAHREAAAAAPIRPLLSDAVFDGWCGGPTPLADCRNRIEREFASGPAVRRQGPDLIIPVDSGAPVVLHDSLADNADYVTYTYGGYSPPLHAHLVRAQGYEGHGWLLVTAHVGHTLYIPSPPVLSPDGTRFIAFRSDLEAMFDLTAIDVWRVSGDSGQHEWHFEPFGNTDVAHIGDWGPTSATWQSGDSITVTTEVRVVANQSPVAGKPVAVVRRDGKWRLVGRAR